MDELEAKDVGRIDIDREEFKKLVDGALEANGNPTGKLLDKFVARHFDGLLSVSGFRNWMRGDNVSYDVRQIYVLASLQQKPLVEAIADICKTTIAHLTGAEEADNRPKFDTVHLQKAIDECDRLAVQHQRLGEILSSLMPVPQAVDSGLPKVGSTIDTDGCASNITLGSMYTSLQCLLKAAFVRANLSWEDGIEQIIKNSGVKKESELKHLRGVMENTTEPDVFLDSYGAIAFGLRQLTGCDWNADMVRQLKTPWSQDSSQGGKTTEAQS